MEHVILKNEVMQVEISLLGAEMKRITCCGREMLWEGDPSVWSGTAPVLFPICGRLKENTYRYGGQEYHLGLHGFLHDAVFAVEEKTEEQVTLVTKSTPETLECYPFSFEFRAIFRLSGKELSIEYVIQSGEEGLYWSVGSHEGYACPEGIEQYRLIFDRPERLECTLLSDNFMTDCVRQLGEPGRELPLRERDFRELSTLIFESLQSRTVTLVNQSGDRSITVEFPDFDYLLVWHEPGGNYICIEPWCGLPDEADGDGDFTKKKGILRIEGEKRFCHRITFE